MFIRHKTTPDGRRYYYIVETVQEGDKTRQKIVKYLGTAEKVLAVFKEAENGNS